MARNMLWITYQDIIAREQHNNLQTALRGNIYVLSPHLGHSLMQISLDLRNIMHKKKCDTY